MIPTISLTDFVDFVISSGKPKLSKVRTIKARGRYVPAVDFWKQLREGIVDFHKSGATNKSQLDSILSTVSNPNRLKRYPDCIKGYKKYLGKKPYSWIGPTIGTWTRGELSIRVNPELGLNVAGQKQIIKLYFKNEKLTAGRIEIILLLLQTALQKQVRAGAEIAILDVPKGKMYTGPADDDMLPLLQGEADSFVTIWNGTPNA
jgi:hypothetical protein